MKLSKNLIWQFLGQGFGKGFTLLFYILLPRFLGLDAYGQFSFAFSFVLIIFQPCVEMGLDILITKWVSRKRFNIFNKVLHLRGVMAIISGIIILSLASMVNLDQTLLLLILIALILRSFENAYFAAFRGIEKMQIEATLIPIQKVLELLFLILLIFFGIQSINIAPISFLCAVVPGLIFCHFFAAKYFPQKNSNSIDSSSYRDIFKEGIVLGGVSFLWILYFRVDSLMLGVLSSQSEVGNYNLAYKLMEAFIFIPSIIMIVFFPKLAKQEQFQKIFNQLLLGLTILGLGGVFILYFAAPGLIQILYGEEFFGAIEVLKILAFVLFPIYLGHLTTQSMVALDCNRVYLLVVLSGTLLNVILNYLSIPTLGAIGAAIATLVTETMVMVLCGYYVSRIVPSALSFKAMVATVKDLMP